MKDDKAISWQSVLPLLEVQIPLIHTHPPPSSFSPPQFSTPSSSLSWHVYAYRSQMCPVAMEEAGREWKTKHEVVWYLINRLQEMWGGWGGWIRSFEVSRVQTVTVCIYRCLVKFLLSWPGPERSRGVSLRIWLGQGEGSWAWRAWISISYDGGVFLQGLGNHAMWDRG